MRASYIIVTSTLLSYKILISGDDMMQFNVCTMLNARACICTIHAKRIAELLRLIYFDKKNTCVYVYLIGVIYEILSITVINSVWTVAPGWHDLWDNATFYQDMHNEFLQSCIRLNISQKKNRDTRVAFDNWLRNIFNMPWIAKE